MLRRAQGLAPCIYSLLTGPIYFYLKKLFIMLSESSFIDWLANNGADQQALQDDTFFDPASRQFYTTDTLVEGQHFSRAYCSAYDIGWKAAAVNISDIAAMGGEPLYLLVSVSVPEAYDMAWLKELYQGLFAACEQFNARIVGGDTVGSPVFSITVTAIGHCSESKQPAHRWLAEAGDLLITTGPHGLSHVGLLTLNSGLDNYPVSQKLHRRPQPQVAAGLLLQKHFSRIAMMDTSDGLADAALKMAQASQKILVLNETQIEIHPELRAYAAVHKLRALDLALYGGEDFQLLACVSAEEWKKQGSELAQSFQIIGKVVDLKDVPHSVEKIQKFAYVNLDREPMIWLPLQTEKTFQHFSR